MRKQIKALFLGFKGFKYQIILKIAAIFLISWAAFLVFIYHEHKLTAIEDQNKRIKFYDSQLEILIKLSKTHLTNTIDNLSELVFNEEYILEVAPESRIEKIDLIWKVLKIKSNYSQLRYYNPSHTLEKSWGLAFDSSKENSLSKEELQKHLENPQGSAFFKCYSECYLHFVKPAAPYSYTEGTFQLSLPVKQLIDPLNAALKLSSANVTILRKDNSLTDSNDIKIGQNTYKTGKSSNNAELSRILEYFTDLKIDHTKRVTIDTDDYFIHPSSAYKKQNILFVFTENLSASTESLYQSYRQIFVLSLLAVLLIFTFLFYLLSKSMVKLRFLSNTMPAIGSGNFSEAKNALQDNLPVEITDELDLIHDTTYNVTLQLEVLHNNLKETLESNRLEHRFVKSILDTADAAIITCDLSYRITSCNNFGARLLGGREQGLIGTDFQQIFDDHDAIIFPTHSLLEGRVLKRESIITRNNKSLHISWGHTLIPETLGGDMQILSIGIDISQRIEYEKGMQFLAEHDPLTSLYNRRKISNIMTKTCSQKIPFALINIDIDHFKVVNDTLGHAIGDELIRSIADILSDEMRDDGFVGRMGGDEFAIIMMESDREIINQKLYNIAQRVNQIRLKSPQVRKANISIGISLYPEHTTSLGNLTSYADIAMYENKKLKKETFHYYTGNETLLMSEKELHYWNERIKDSLENNLITVYFQPLVDKNTHEIFSYEVLARFICESTRSIMASNSFIPFAEKTHTVIKIDRRIIDLALAKASLQPEHPVIMLNLSNITVASHGMSEYILDRISYYQYPPEKVVFEITESSEISDLEQSTKFIQTLRSHGISFALDDFGSGFSSFFYLKILKVDYLKIDKKIITGLLEDDNDQHIISSITMLAKKFGIKTVAEGVESQELLDIVNNFDIDFLQGYHFARPNPEILTTLTPGVATISDKPPSEVIQQSAS